MRPSGITDGIHHGERGKQSDAIRRRFNEAVGYYRRNREALNAPSTPFRRGSWQLQ